jgi:hypothetical protein
MDRERQSAIRLALARMMHKPSTGKRNRDAPQKISAVKRKWNTPRWRIQPGLFVLRKYIAVGKKPTAKRSRMGPHDINMPTR